MFLFTEMTQGRTRRTRRKLPPPPGCMPRTSPKTSLHGGNKSPASIKSLSKPPSQVRRLQFTINYADDGLLTKFINFRTVFSWLVCPKSKTIKTKLPNSCLSFPLFSSPSCTFPAPLLLLLHNNAPIYSGHVSGGPNWGPVTRRGHRERSRGSQKKKKRKILIMTAAR